MTVSCPHCKQDGEHAEMYRGCMRPCPHCGELVSLATRDDAPVKRAPTEECWCGKARDERGVDFVLEHRVVKNPRLILVWLAYYLPILFLLPEFRSKITLTHMDGWACEGCSYRVRWLRIWQWALLPLAALLSS